MKASSFAVHHVVEVLHTDDVRNLSRLVELLGSDIAYAKMTNQSLPLQFGKHSQWFFDGTFRWPCHSSDPEVNEVQSADSEISKIVMNGVDQFLGRNGVKPRLVCSASKAHLGNDHQAVRARVERLLDNLISHVRTVKVTGVDVVHARRNRSSQDANCGANVRGGPQTPGPASCIAP
jgi:hypothetical protein